MKKSLCAMLVGLSLASSNIVLAGPVDTASGSGMTRTKACLDAKKDAKYIATMDYSSTVSWYDECDCEEREYSRVGYDDWNCTVDFRVEDTDEDDE